MAILKEKRRRSVIPALYAAILLMVALAAWNPILPGGAGAIDMMLVMDESESINRDHNNSVWASFLRHSKSLPAGSRVGLIRFADRANVEIPWTAIEQTDFVKLSQYERPPRHSYLDQGASDIKSAIETAIHQASINRRSVILISSDGIDTVNSESTALPVLTRGPSYSFFHVKPAQDQSSAAVEIDSINLPPRVSAGRSLPLSIAIRSNRESEASLEIIHNRKTAIKQDLLLQPGALKVLNYQLPVDQPGTQTLEFLIRDPQQNIMDKLERVADVTGGGQLLYIGKSSVNATHALALPQGWETVQLQPDQLTNSETFFNPFDLVLIDNLEASSLNPAIIRNLKASVQQSGTGLMIIGGPDSFGSGGYRHSELEKLLPVTAESSRPLPASAFLFLLDKSGSMDTSNNRQSRLADAFRAVLETAKSIRAGDESALLVFDREVQVLLPLKHRADLKSALDKPWHIKPSGGTQLTIALNKATELLANSDSPQRFLILVTDGFVNVENIEQLEYAMRQTNIRLIALATGSDANLGTLRQLSTSSGGQILRINDTAQLPRFMRQQLEITQRSWSDKSVTPTMILRPPFMDKKTSDWKPLQGHQITRAKPAARVYLATPHGDPLLAVDRYGAGKVAVLPGGMLETRSSENFSQALISWMNNRQQNPNLQVSHRYASTRLTLAVDAVASDNNWQSPTSAEVILTNPTGTSRAQPLEMVAPGRFSAVMEAPGAGIYKASINIGEQGTMFSLHLNNDVERTYENIAPWFQKALDTGDIKPWTETAFSNALSSSTAGYKTGPLWLVLALVTFLGLMAVEHSLAFYWLGKIFRNKLTGKSIIVDRP